MQNSKKTSWLRCLIITIITWSAEAWRIIPCCIWFNQWRTFRVNLILHCVSVLKRSLLATSKRKIGYPGGIHAHHSLPHFVHHSEIGSILNKGIARGKYLLWWKSNGAECVRSTNHRWLFCKQRSRELTYDRNHATWKKNKRKKKTESVLQNN